MKRYLDQKLKVRQLRAIAAVAASGSLQKAALTLGVTQPALTKILREIEDMFGARLFERHARGVEPNAYGALVVEAARRILDILHDVEEGFDRIDDRVGGILVVGALPVAAAGVMPEVIRRMRESDPDVAIRVIEDRTDELMASLAVGDIDLVIGRLYPPVRPDDNLVRTELYDEPMSVIVGAQHPLAGRTGVEPDELATFELSLPIATLRIHADTVAYLESCGIAMSEGPTTTSLTLLRELLMSSPLVTVMPRLILAGDILRGSLCVVSLNGRSVAPRRPAGLIHRADRPLVAPAQRFSAIAAAYAHDVLARTSR